MQSTSDWTELHHTAFVRDVNKVRRILIATPHFMYKQDKEGWTPAHLACSDPGSDAFMEMYFGHRSRRRKDYPLYRADISYFSRSNVVEEFNRQTMECVVLFIQRGFDVCFPTKGRDGGLTML